MEVSGCSIHTEGSQESQVHQILQQEEKYRATEGEGPPVLPRRSNPIRRLLRAMATVLAQLFDVAVDSGPIHTFVGLELRK